VAEWCQDRYADTRDGGKDPDGSAVGTQRVGRGGGWADAPRDCRSARRLAWAPARCSSNVGFRVVAAVGEVPPESELPYRQRPAGEEAKRAAVLEKQAAELAGSGRWAEALPVARELHTLRVRVQGPGHWQAADAGRLVQTAEKLNALPEAERAKFRKA